MKDINSTSEDVIRVTGKNRDWIYHIIRKLRKVTQIFFYEAKHFEAGKLYMTLPGFITLRHIHTDLPQRIREFQRNSYEQNIAPNEEAIL